jgi:hypothetical protein
MTRPEDLLYGVDEMPPWPRLLFLGMQHAMVLSVNLVLIVIVFRRAGAGDAATLSALSLGMIALAISTVLQSIRRRPVGSGYLAPPVFSAIYIGPAVLAAGTGGLPAVFGMTMFAGLVEIGLAPLLRKLRALFPPAISGLIVVIVGLQLGVIGIGDLLGVEHINRPTFHYHLIIGGLTLGMMCALSVWGRGIARLICSMLGVVIGMLASVAAGLVPADSMRSFLDAPILAVPEPHYLAYDFRFSLVPAFLMAGTAAMLRTVGVITTCQKINDLDWKRPELKSIQAGIVADGIGCLLGGLLGVMGMNSAVGPVRRRQSHRRDEPLHRIFLRGDPRHSRCHSEICRSVLDHAAAGDRGIDGVYRLVHDLRGYSDHRLAKHRQPSHLRRRRFAAAGALPGGISGVFQAGRAAAAPVYRQHDVNRRLLGLSAQSDLPNRRNPQCNIGLRGFSRTRGRHRKAVASARQGMVDPLGRH